MYSVVAAVLQNSGMSFSTSPSSSSPTCSSLITMGCSSLAARARRLFLLYLNVHREREGGRGKEGEGGGGRKCAKQSHADHRHWCISCPNCLRFGHNKEQNCCCQHHDADSGEANEECHQYSRVHKAPRWQQAISACATRYLTCDGSTYVVGEKRMK